MAESLLLALDQGTTSTRAILFDRRGQPLSTASRQAREAACARWLGAVARVRS